MGKSAGTQGREWKVYHLGPGPLALVSARTQVRPWEHMVRSCAVCWTPTAVGLEVGGVCSGCGSILDLEAYRETLRSLEKRRKSA